MFVCVLMCCAVWTPARTLASLLVFLLCSLQSPAWVKPRFLTHIMGPLIAVIVIASTFATTEKLDLFSL